MCLVQTFLSGNLNVNPAEVSLVSPREAEDRPAYSDENISVFALPVAPSAKVSVPRGEAVSPLKRKREDSPKGSKRLLSQHLADQPKGDIMVTTQLLRKAASASDFDPAELTGELAQAWRQVVIQSMFPASSDGPDQNGLGKCQEPQKMKGRGPGPLSGTPSTAARSPFPPKFSKPLPVPEEALIGSSDPAVKPTIAYAIVGPRIRGKFDGRKAVELGLPPGPLRAKLVKGESVTVQVKDSNGNVVDREIKPEDCIGENVTPAVS